MKKFNRIVQGVSVISFVIWALLSMYSTLKNFDANVLTATLILPIIGSGYFLTQYSVKKWKTRGTRPKKTCSTCGKK